MCIYCGTDKYRKIFLNHHGIIPKDEEGRSYEIHHIDGNHSNNEPKNLKAVSLQEHYNIHYNQGDYGACMKLKQRLNLSSDEHSKLASLNNKKMWAELGDKHPAYLNNKERVSKGTHNFLGGVTNKIRIEEGTHNWIQKWVCTYCNKNGSNMSLFVRWGHNNGKCLLPRDFIPVIADPTVYTWYNVKTKEYVELTRTELARKYNLNSRDIYRVVKKKIKTTKGWKLL